MKLHSLVASLVVGVVGSSLVACVAQPSTPEEAEAAEAQSARTVTIVTLLPDGTHTTRVEPAPGGDGLATESLTKAGGCPASSDWFFDEPGGQGNEICFSGTGTVDLSTFADGTGTWAEKIASYTTQASDGYFSANTTGTENCLALPADAVAADVPTLTCSGRYLTLGAACPAAAPPLVCPTGDFPCTIRCPNACGSSNWLQSCHPLSVLKGAQQDPWCYENVRCP
jgi:hypothetical protein